jgi:hypothetical protein
MDRGSPYRQIERIDALRGAPVIYWLSKQTSAMCV